MAKQLAIISGVGFGNRDVGHPVLFFTAMVSEGSGALQVLDIEEAIPFIEAYGVYDVHELDDKPVWVNCGDTRITLLGPWKGD